MKNLIALFVLVLLTSACGSGNSTTTSTETSSGNNIDAYLAIKDALVETNAEKASEAAKSFMKANTNDQLTASLETIANTTDVKAQRAAFETLSMNMYDIVKANKGETVLYKQYCPMAFNNKGAYWLAAEQEVNNPYFGDMMLHCGSVEETINQ